MNSGIVQCSHETVHWTLWFVCYLWTFLSILWIFLYSTLQLQYVILSKWCKEDWEEWGMWNTRPVTWGFSSEGKLECFYQCVPPSSSTQNKVDVTKSLSLAPCLQALFIMGHHGPIWANMGQHGPKNGHRFMNRKHAMNCFIPAWTCAQGIM